MFAARASSAWPRFALVERRREAPMVDFSFFRSRTFLGANIVAFIVSFAMLAMFFFLALYMQNIRGYSPLQAGVRFLPSTVMIIMIAPLAGRLADRVGSRPLITFGLLCVSGALFWQSHLTVSSGYGALLPGFMLMGVGMGFVMSPMSLAAMNAVDRTKAGVASGILSMNRMVGGTFGVADPRRARRDARALEDRPAAPAACPTRRARASRAASARAASSTAFRPGHRRGQQAFVYALHYGLLLGSGVALLGALAAVDAHQAPPRRAGAGRVRATPDLAQTRDQPAVAQPSATREAESPGRVREPETIPPDADARQGRALPQRSAG